MREPLKDRVRLEHILTAIDNIFQYTEGKTIQQFNDDTAPSARSTLRPRGRMSC